MEQTKIVLQDVEMERIRQIKLWGEQHHSMEKWFVILSEEIGEVAQALQCGYKWRKTSDKSNLYEELIHVAAVAVKMAEEVRKKMKIVIEGEPVAQGRPRFSTINGLARVYDPAKSRNYKKLVQNVAQHHVSKPLDRPINLVIDVYKTIPKSFSKKKRLEAAEGTLRPITKPDIDNYIKGILDGLNGVAWVDDNRIVGLTVNKFYSEHPRVEVEII